MRKKINIEMVASIISLAGVALQLVSGIVNDKIETKNSERFKRDIAKEVVKEIKRAQ